MKINLRSIHALMLILGFQLINVAIFANSLPAENTVFYNVSLTTAKQLAAEEGKNIFVEFYADWCVPCKWMEETTFADPVVQQKLKEDYIALRIDIDDFDGFALKEHYGINVLPTIMILDKNGRSLERKEQSLTAEMLVTILETNPSMTVTAPVNSSPSTEGANLQKIIKDKNNTSEHTDNTNRATVKTTSYRVQVGVFTDYANTETMVEKLRKMTDEPIVVLNDYMNSKTVFKILVGDFDSKETATQFKNELWQIYGIDGFVK